ncbi:MAG: RNA polymerase sigma factor [Candidatus Cyclobacteriaceae bacterium M3_2C_046]
MIKNLEALQKNIHQDLIEACIAGSREAQYQLYKSYAKAMYNICYRIVNDFDEAEDVLQDAFIQAFNNLPSFKSTGSFGSWLKRIVVNTALNHLKKKSRFMLVDEFDENIPADQDNSLSDQQAVLNVEKIKKAIQKLPDGFRIVFSLYLLEGYDHGEIGQILNISVSTSKSQYLRAKKKLKEILKEEFFYEN